MTAPALESEPTLSEQLPQPRRKRVPWQRLSLFALPAATAVLYLWNLSASGWANSFYAAAVQAGSSNWKAMLFGSSDAANAITVDKTPAALWIMDISARLFGFNSWSLLVPQALEGVAAVMVLYAAVRRTAGHGAGLLAGAVLALTPVAVLMFRFDNPDALLVLLLTVAAYCLLRGLEKDSSTWWLVAAGSAIGFGFLTKMLQAFLVLPVFASVYLFTAPVPVRRRVSGLVAAAVAMVISGGWYLLLVELWPAESRPYIGGSQNNSVLELALGYNGVGRLTGNETGGLGNMNFDVGWNRLFGSNMGGQISWLLPAAMILTVAGLILTWRHPRTDRLRAGLLLWAGWLVVTGVVFSYMNGIVHPYYTAALAPAVAALIGTGGALVWQRRHDIRASVTLAGTVAVTAVYACVLLGRTSDWLPWLRLAIGAVGVATALLLVVVGRLPRPVGRIVLACSVVVGLAAPTAYSLATAATSHRGAIPSAGPAGSGMFGGPPHTAHRGDGAGHSERWGGGGPMAMFGSGVVGAKLTSELQADANRYTWVAATVGSSSAAGYQLAAGHPVMAIGGFNGTDPAPTLGRFQKYVAAKQIHWFIGGGLNGRIGRGHSGSQEAATIAKWVAANFTAQTVDGVTVYDLTQ